MNSEEQATYIRPNQVVQMAKGSKKKEGTLIEKDGHGSKLSSLGTW